MTLDAWAELGEGEDESGELVDGFLTEEEAPDPVHELAVSWLIRLIGNWLEHRGGFVFGSDVKLAINSQRGRKPDVSVYLPGSARPPRRGLLRVPPDIVVEVVTPTARDERRDRVEKMAEYEALGIRYYWLLDPALGSLEIFERGPEAAGAKYTKVVGATSGRHAVPGCEGLALDLDELWEELERLGPDEVDPSA